MSRQQLPQQANLRQLKRQAKDLQKAYRSGTPEAISRVREGLPRLSGAADEVVIAAACTLQDIQHVIAVEYGFEDWGHLRREVSAMNGDRLPVAQEAIRQGDLEALKRELGRDANLVHQRSASNDSTLLHIAASEGQTAIVRALIESGADVEATCGEGWRPLHNAAVQENSVAIVELLLEAGADPTAEACGDGGTPISHALFYGLPDEADCLAVRSVEPPNLRVAAGLGRIDMIEQLVSVVGTLTPEAGKGRGFYRHHAEFPEWTPSEDPQEILDEALVYAAKNGRLEAVDVLIQRGANVNAVPYSAAALHEAVMKGHRDVVDLLLSRGADPTVRDNMHGGRAYDWAPYSSTPELIDVLLKAGAQTDLYAAVRLGLAEQTEKLAREASVEQLTFAYKTAVWHESPELAKALMHLGASPTLFDLIELGQAEEVVAALGSGADPNVSRDWKVELMGNGLVTRTQTAFQAAASGYHREIGEALAQAGANVDFHAAAFLDRVALIEDRKGENVDEIDGFGLTALHRAIQGGAEGSVRRLLEMGASVEVSSDTYTFGGKAIHVAATTDATPKMIDMLIQAGADVNQDMNPGTPLRVAERSGRGKTAEVLRGMGAVE